MAAGGWQRWTGAQHFLWIVAMAVLVGCAPRAMAGIDSIDGVTFPPTVTVEGHVLAAERRAVSGR